MLTVFSSIFVEGAKIILRNNFGVLLMDFTLENWMWYGCNIRSEL